MPRPHPLNQFNAFHPSLMNKKRPVDFDSESDELDVSSQLDPKRTSAVVTGTDWTTETVIAQLSRGNIQLNPRFQRRDAWRRDRKSRFIESLLVGLPIPQIVLAEAPNERGKFIVLDGKQRLLAIMQFWGSGTGPDNAYPLSGLTLRSDLRGVDFQSLSSNSLYAEDYNSLCNQSIRTVVIRNWVDTDFLHTVFLRLNTGSVALSPQELRQALFPGEFSNYIDDEASKSPGLQKLLGLNGPDPRMRDIEILARFIAFRFFAQAYPGRMKAFLDYTFQEMNDNWRRHKPQVASAIADFEAGVNDLNEILGDEIARKPDSSQFNRAIFDALIYFQSQRALAKKLKSKHKEVRSSYKALFEDGTPFAKAIESDTAGTPNTRARLKIWGRALANILGEKVTSPKVGVEAK